MDQLKTISKFTAWLILTIVIAYIVGAILGLLGWFFGMMTGICWSWECLELPMFAFFVGVIGVVIASIRLWLNSIDMEGPND